jgi:hydrogenase expression/formation protein HypC
MCIGLPMRTVEAWSGQALVEGRGRVETIDTRLVGECVAGDWLLVFQGAAREKLDAERAAEIDAALDLLEAGLSGDVLGAGADPGFALPSAMSAQQLAELTGGASAPGTSRGSTVNTSDHTSWLHALSCKPAPT